MSYEQRPVGTGAALLIRTASPTVLPSVPWPKAGLHVVVLHLVTTPPPVLVEMLPRLRSSLGQGWLYLAWHGAESECQDTFTALRLTGHVLRARTPDHGFSCWSGSNQPAKLPVVAAPVLRRGDLSNRLSKEILRLDPGTREVLEIWPRRGRFAAAAVRAGCKPTVIAYPTDTAYDRLTTFLDNQKR